jgi:hypothetical protein
MSASVALKATGMAICVLTALSANLFPLAIANSGYETASRVMSGAMLIAGSALLVRRISVTFLRSGGVPAFKVLYLATMSAAGLGTAEAFSSFANATVWLPAGITTVLYLISGVMLYWYFLPREAL